MKENKKRRVRVLLLLSTTLSSLLTFTIPFSLHQTALAFKPSPPSTSSPSTGSNPGDNTGDRDNSQFGNNIGSNSANADGNNNNNNQGGFDSQGQTSISRSGDNSEGSPNNQQSGIPVANSNFIRHNIPALRLTIQTPANWKGPTSCLTSYTGGVLHIKSSQCVSTWTPDIPKAQFNVRREFSVSQSNKYHVNLDQLAKEIKSNAKDRRVSPNIIDVLGMEKGILKGVYPEYVYKFTQRNPTDDSIDNRLSVLLGTPDYMPWLLVNFSANPSEYNQLMPTVQKILDSIELIDTSNNNNAQLLDSTD